MADLFEPAMRPACGEYSPAIAERVEVYQVFVLAGDARGKHFHRMVMADRASARR